MSADEIKAAMRAAEDEGDVAAAAAAEKEAAAEMDEFTKVGVLTHVTAVLSRRAVGPRR